METSEVKPFIHCVMPTTSSRRWCIARSINCWLAQSYPEDRRRLVIIDGPNPDGESVFDLVPAHPAIDYMRLEPGAHATPGDKYNLGAEYGKPDDWIALWADDDWHHPNRLSYVADIMVAADVEIGGTISSTMYRQTDKQLFLYSAPFMIERRSEEQIAVQLPYLFGGTMIFSRRLWAEVEGFKPMPRGTDSEFVVRAIRRAEDWDVLSMRVSPAWGDRCCVASGVTFHADGREIPWGVVQINEPRLYCAVIHGANTGNPVKGAREGAAVDGEGAGGDPNKRSFVKLGAEEEAVLRGVMGERAVEFLI